MTFDPSLELAYATDTTQETTLRQDDGSAQMLGKRFIPLAHHFLESARAALPKGKKYFLKPKSETDMRDHLDNGASLLGIVSEKKLLMAFGIVGQSTSLQFPHDHAVIQSVCSSQKGLGKKIVRAAEDWARDNNYTALSAKVSQENIKSLAMFESCGFDAITEGFDYTGHYPYYILTKHLG